MMRLALCLVFVTTALFSQNHDPHAVQIVTSDIDNFWIAFDSAQPDFGPAILQEYYLDKGSKGVEGFMQGRIKDAANLSKVVKRFPKYYASIRNTTTRIPSMKDQIVKSFVKLKEIYPEAVFPPIYFVIGAMSTAGTVSPDGIIVGTEIFGRTDEAFMDELTPSAQKAIRSPDKIPYNVAHEIVHIQQPAPTYTLLEKSLKEGSADFIGEMISGKHINQNVHDYANPKEKELWMEFKKRMFKRNYEGWLYGPSPGRPNDLGYWMGYQVVKAYYDKQPDKQKAIHDIINITDAKRFLKASGYGDSFR